MIIQFSTYVSFESSSTVEPLQRIFNIYIYLYVSDQSVFIGSEADPSRLIWIYSVCRLDFDFGALCDEHENCSVLF